MSTPAAAPSFDQALQTLMDLIQKKPQGAEEARALMEYVMQVLKAKIAADLPEAEAAVFKGLVKVKKVQEACCDPLVGCWGTCYKSSKK